MGITCVVRWRDATGQGSINYIQERALKIYQGRHGGRWSLHCRLYREAAPRQLQSGAPQQRLMYHLALSQYPGQLFCFIDDLLSPDGTLAQPAMMVSSSSAMEQLVSRLKFAWIQRQSMQVEGYTYILGDFTVRAANVSIGGAGYRGMIVEAEYSPIGTIPKGETWNECMRMLTELVASLLPEGADISYDLTLRDVQDKAPDSNGTKSQNGIAGSQKLDFSKASLDNDGAFTPLHTAYQYINLFKHDHVM